MAEMVDLPHGDTNGKPENVQFFRENEIRSARDADFNHFIHLVDDCSEGTGWVKKFDKNSIAVWQKEIGAGPVKMALVS